jgi:Flp pilus assembly protein TadD
MNRAEKRRQQKLAIKAARRSPIQRSNASQQSLMSPANIQAPSHTELNSLLEHYQSGRYNDAEMLAISITEQFPHHAFTWKVLAVVFTQTGRISEALVANQKALEIDPQDAEVHNNLGNTLQELGRSEEAVASCRQAIALESDFFEAHNNLGNSLQELGRSEEAEASVRKAIALKPDFAEAHYNLGNTLQELGRSEEAEASYRQAIALRSDFAEAHYNLGNTLQELGRSEEAEASYRQAIALRSDFAEAHSNLGAVLLNLGRLEEAEALVRKAIELKSDLAKAHYNLGIIHYVNSDKDSALDSIERANCIDPKLRSCRVLMSVLKARKSREITEISVGNISKSGSDIGLISNPLILNRPVESKLLAYLYERESLDLDKRKDPSYGNTRGSDYKLFEDDHSIIRTVEADLKCIIREAVKLDVFVDDSFFSIFGAGGGTIRHTHLVSLDKISGLGLASQKYSLVYYLSIGDQDCSEPGILKFFDPSEDILPSEGMITIFPSDRYHSSVYGGKTDRVIIGINFYAL